MNLVTMRTGGAQKALHVLSALAARVWLLTRMGRFVTVEDRNAIPSPQGPQALSLPAQTGGEGNLPSTSFGS
jgi:hypothetical protein